MSKTCEELFFALFRAKNEADVNSVITSNPGHFGPGNWFPLGKNDNNFSIIENQQSHPVAALVEKLTNSIDAILMRRCLEQKIDPRSAAAPVSLEDAVREFFPGYKHWDLSQNQRAQAESIQIVADGHHGPREDTSLVVYDDGEGQHPDNFEKTFLSLIRGNKNDIQFVQGKYNMGGTGAIVFCGKQRYQLVGSRRFDGGPFGWTLVRRHPYSEAEGKKNTWYEYLKLSGQIPAFEMDELDLGLSGRKFSTGTVLKLYSYEVKSNKHLRRDLGRSLNEFLYEPALPVLTVETRERYPNDKVLEAVMFGLKRRLHSRREYLADTFSEVYEDHRIGKMSVTVHVFKPRIKDKTPGETKKTIQAEFFKNRMAVLFSLNGQVHGHYTSEFITRSLGYSLLRDYLLIHVDCTEMKYQFRSELFMASRDRLKQGEEASHLRRVLADNLKKGELAAINKRRKDSLSVDNVGEDEMVKSLASNLPMNSDLRELLSRTFKLTLNDKTRGKDAKEQPRSKKSQGHRPDFSPRRYPSFFRLSGSKGETPVVSIPLNGTRSLKFDSDVENQYFDRSEDPGDLEIALLRYSPNEETGGDRPGIGNELSRVMTVSRQSPRDGTIKVVMSPTRSVQVGDCFEVKVDLKGAGDSFSQILTVRISEPRKEVPKTESVPKEEPLGLPALVKVFRSLSEALPGATTWSTLGEQGIDMSHENVMFPVIDNGVLEKVFINMDSSVLKSFKSKLKSPEQLTVADRRYLSSIYFHTLFLYTISKNRGYEINQNIEDEGRHVDLATYLQDVFSSHYAAFLLNFGMDELVSALA